MEKNIDKPKNMSSKKEQESNNENKIEVWTPQDKELFRSRYGCEILKQNCSLEEAQDTEVPTDAYIVSYVIDDQLCYDLTRTGKRSNIFDMYYDNLGPVVRNIDWGYGKLNPKTWGYKAPEKKKRK